MCILHRREDEDWYWNGRLSCLQRGRYASFSATFFIFHMDWLACNKLLTIRKLCRTQIMTDLWLYGVAGLILCKTCKGSGYSRRLWWLFMTLNYYWTIYFSDLVNGRGLDCILVNSQMGLIDSESKTFLLWSHYACWVIFCQPSGPQEYIGQNLRGTLMV